MSGIKSVNAGAIENALSWCSRRFVVSGHLRLTVQQKLPEEIVSVFGM